MSLLQSSLFPEIMLEISGWQLDASLLTVLSNATRLARDISNEGTQTLVACQALRLLYQSFSLVARSSTDSPRGRRCVSV
jgi:hypothetical protein